LKYEVCAKEFATGISRPAGLILACAEDCFGYRGDAAGDKDFSENVVVGDSVSFGCFPEFHPKNDVNLPAAGDFGLLRCGESAEAS
jgi:hypothetical protein